MLLLEFDRELFRFTLNTPVLEVLFHLPPQIGKRNSLFPKRIRPRLPEPVPFILCRKFPSGFLWNWRIFVYPLLISAYHASDFFGASGPFRMRR